MPKQSDPFDILIGLRDQLARNQERSLPELSATPSQRYESARRSFEAHARRRTPGQAAAAALLPPIDELSASEYGVLGLEVPAFWSNRTTRISLDIWNAHEADLMIEAEAVGEESVSVVSSPPDPIASNSRARRELTLQVDGDPPTAPFRVDLREGSALYGRLLVSPADEPAPRPVALTLQPVDSLVVSALRGLQRLVLDHPVAARRIFGGLVAEGRAFAKTSRGSEWSERLQNSELLRQARLVVQMTSLSMLEHSDEPDALPSAYLEALFAASSSEESDDLLNRLFGEDTP